MAAQSAERAGKAVVKGESGEVHRDQATKCPSGLIPVLLSVLCLSMILCKWNRLDLHVRSISLAMEWKMEIKTCQMSRPAIQVFGLLGLSASVCVFISHPETV